MLFYHSPTRCQRAPGVVSDTCWVQPGSSAHLITQKKVFPSRDVSFALSTFPFLPSYHFDVMPCWYFLHCVMHIQYSLAQACGNTVHMTERTSGLSGFSFFSSPLLLHLQPNPSHPLRWVSWMSPSRPDCMHCSLTLGRNSCPEPVHMSECVAPLPATSTAVSWNTRVTLGPSERHPWGRGKHF